MFTTVLDSETLLNSEAAVGVIMGDARASSTWE